MVKIASNLYQHPQAKKINLIRKIILGSILKIKIRPNFLSYVFAGLLMCSQGIQENS